MEVFASWSGCSVPFRYVFPSSCNPRVSPVIFKLCCVVRHCYARTVNQHRRRRPEQIQVIPRSPEIFPGLRIMPTRSASDYLSFVKAQVVSNPNANRAAVPQARNVLRYEGAGQYLTAVTQLSAMRYATTGQLVPSRVAPRQVVMNRSNPKSLSQVGILSGGGVLGGVVSRPVARTSGTQGLIVLQTNLIQNANQNAGRGGGNFLPNNPAITRG